MVLMLVLLAGFFILQNVLLASLSFVEQKVEVVAYVQQNATDDQVQTLIDTTKAMPEVASVEFVSRDEALERFKATQAAQGREDLTPVPRDRTRSTRRINVKLTDPIGPRRGRRAPCDERPDRPQRPQHRRRS